MDNRPQEKVQNVHEDTQNTSEGNEITQEEEASNPSIEGEATRPIVNPILIEDNDPDEPNEDDDEVQFIPPPSPPPEIVDIANNEEVVEPEGGVAGGNQLIDPIALIDEIIGRGLGLDEDNAIAQINDPDYNPNEHNPRPPKRQYKTLKFGNVNKKNKWEKRYKDYDE